MPSVIIRERDANVLIEVRTGLIRLRIGRWRVLANAGMSPLLPYNVRNFLTSYEKVSFSRRALLHVVSSLVRSSGRHTERINVSVSVKYSTGPGTDTQMHNYLLTYSTELSPC